MNKTVLALEVTEHPEEYTGAGVIEISDEGASFGRGERSQVRLPDVNKYVSSTHCLITTYGDEFFINDVSTNGTYINGKKLEKNQPTTLSEGDALLIGRYKFTARVERKFISSRIDQDITPDINVTDPLELIENQLPDVNLAISEPLSTLAEELSGNVQIDSNDPLELLTDTTEHEDLIGKVEMTPEPDPFRSQKQLADDSNDIQAEMPLPIIPDDWFDGLGETKSSAAATSNAIVSDSNNSSSLSESNISLQSFDLPNEKSEAFSALEGKTESALTFNTHTESKPNSTYSSEMGLDNHVFSDPKRLDSIDTSRERLTITGTSVAANNDQLMSFLRGAGLDASAAENDQAWFESLGECIRLCLGDLVKQLNHSQEYSANAPANTMDTDAMLNLMQKLHSEHQIMPKEFFEEMLSDTENLRDIKERSMYQMTQTVLNDLHPENFASQSALGIKSHQSWKAYQAYYSQNFELTEIEVMSMLKDKLARECVKTRTNQ